MERSRIGLPYVLCDTDTAAGLFRLPQRPHGGFRVLETKIESGSKNSFNIIPPDASGGRKGISVGVIAESGLEYRLDPRKLREHVSIFAAPGGGKSNTIQLIAIEADKQRIPFLIIEPSLKNHRGLAKHIPGLKVFSRDSAESSLRLNILQPEPGVLIADHIDELMYCFKGAFGEMEPAIAIALSNLLKFAYRKHGMDINALSDMYFDFPTLRDMYSLLGVFEKELLYGREVQSNIIGALEGRLASLISGSAGIILNAAGNTPASAFCENPAVVELDELALETKALVASCLLLKINRHYRNKENSLRLENLLILEEAHNVFGNYSDMLSAASPKAVASAFFSDMVAQLRNLGVGVVLADQSPSAVGRAAINNTRTKIVGVLQSREDVDAVSQALRLSDFQKGYLGRLRPGEAIISISGSPEVCKVQIHRVKD